MNKNINVILIFLLIVLFLYSTIPGFDVNLFGDFRGLETPYLTETFFIGTAVVALLFIFRAFQRWMAIRLVKDEKKFVWISPISKSRLSRVKLYLILENSHLPFFGIYFILIHPATFLLGIVCFASFLETLIFLFVNANQRKMKSGITTQAVVLCDREAKVFYFSGLRKVSLIQDAVYMEYKDDLTMDFPANCVEDDKRADFVKHFIEQINPDKVFISETFKYMK